MQFSNNKTPAVSSAACVHPTMVEFTIRAVVVPSVIRPHPDIFPLMKLLYLLNPDGQPLIVPVNVESGHWSKAKLFIPVIIPDIVHVFVEFSPALAGDDMTPVIVEPIIEYKQFVDVFPGFRAHPK